MKTLEKPKTTAKIVSNAEWEAAQKAFLVKEKEFTHQREALSAQRRQLPWTKVEKDYVFDGPSGKVSLSELFQGRRQLVVYHFMFDPAWEEGCPGCSHVADNVDGAVVHLAARDTSLVFVSRAPMDKITPFKWRMSWQVPWVSSFNNSFNYDYHVTLDEDRGSTQYNFESVKSLDERGKIHHTKGEMPGASVFIREGDAIYRTYSVFGRGLDPMLNTYNFLDLTAMGRQEDEGCAQKWVRHHDKYEHSPLATPGASASCCSAEKAKK
ncbi:MAG: DUF899 domain-containing protein [Phycisphaerales bacterium]|jgi:predicted dithiol-disulfide oxidoreductase (DUF899 family)